MSDERERAPAPRGATQEPAWWAAALHECRKLLFAGDFPGGAEFAARCGARARREGDERAWRRFANQQAFALNGACRFEEALVLCDEVIGSTVEAEDRSAVAHAWNIGAAAAQRLSRDDVLRRVDAALAIGEWFLDEQGRVDSLGRAAATAASLGLAEIGDSVFRRVMADIDTGAAGSMSHASVVWIKTQGITARIWWAMTLEFRDDPRAAAVYEDVVEVIRFVAAGLPAGPGLFGMARSVMRAQEGLVLVALGRTEEARELLAVAAAIPPAPSRTLFSAGIELNCGFAALRQGTVRGREAAELASRLVQVAQWSGDMYVEAEAWRLAACAAAADGDRPAHRIARERFEAVAERLDWSRRLQAAELLTFRSRTLRRIVEGEDWLRTPTSSVPSGPGTDDRTS